MDTKSESKLKIYISNISYFVMAILILILGINFLSKSEKLFNIFKLRSYVILSGSMEPNIMTGDLVFVKKANGEDLKVNDVVTFKYGEYSVTHRVIDKDEKAGTLITKGDNNEKPDNNPLKNEDVIGKVIFKIPYVGYIISFLAKPISLMIFMGILGIYILWRTFKE